MAVALNFYVVVIFVESVERIEKSVEYGSDLDF
jgi:hypothetical protein